MIFHKGCGSSNFSDRELASVGGATVSLGNDVRVDQLVRVAPMFTKKPAQRTQALIGRAYAEEGRDKKRRDAEDLAAANAFLADKSSQWARIVRNNERAR